VTHLAVPARALAVVGAGRARGLFFWSAGAFGEGFDAGGRVVVAGGAFAGAAAGLGAVLAVDARATEGSCTSTCVRVRAHVCIGAPGTWCAVLQGILATDFALAYIHHWNAGRGACTNKERHAERGEPQ
jgi:hypothetical protein